MNLEALTISQFLFCLFVCFFSSFSETFYGGGFDERGQSEFKWISIVNVPKKKKSKCFLNGTSEGRELNRSLNFLPQNRKKSSEANEMDNRKAST